MMIIKIQGRSEKNVHTHRGRKVYEFDTSDVAKKLKVHFVTISIIIIRACLPINNTFFDYDVIQHYGY